MKARIKILLFAAVLALLASGNVLAQDTLSLVRKQKKELKLEPRRASMLALTFPGFGQIYNRKYWKLPFVYAGFGGVVFAAGYNGSMYNRFMKGYQDFTDLIPETDSYLDIITNADPSTYDPVLYPDSYRPSDAAWYKDRMLKQIDYFKKYRDLSYIGVALWYLVTVLDANVDASLFNYDVIDNLELGLEPVHALGPSPQGVGINLTMKLTF